MALTRCAAPSPSASTSIGDWPLVYAADFDGGATSLFRWDAGTIGVLDTVRPRVLLFTLDPDGQVRHSEVALRLDPKSGPAAVYPDVVQRHADGTLYWLVRRTQVVLQLNPDGSLKRAFPVSTSPDPCRDGEGVFWMDLDRDGSVAVLDLRSEPRVSYTTWSAGGDLTRQEPGWLTPTQGRSDLAGAFFFRFAAGTRVEILARFPYARLTRRGEREVVVRLDQAEHIPPRLRTSFELEERAYGLPHPLGTGTRGRGPRFPFAVAAARGPDGCVYVLANGNVLLRFDPADGGIASWPIPPPAGASSTPYALVSLTLVDRHLAILSRTREGMQRLRIWRTSS